MKLNYKLDEDHIKKYKKDGYIICRNLFDNKTVQKLISSIDKVEKYNDSKGKWMKYYNFSLKNKNKKILNRIENFYDYNQELKKILSNKSLKLQLRKIAGEEMVLFKDKINFKNPGGEGFKPHQDATIWKDMYGIKSFISLAIAIDKATIENGCLEFSKFNKRILLSKPWKEISKNKEKQMLWETVEMNPGDAVIFHDYSPHRSSKNLSNKKRRMIFLTFNPKKFGNFRKQHFYDKRKNFPPNEERQAGKKYVYHV
jgi:ectoine hydroxylase-related dioxygenase (phytanoyl-CoA dioxygenase family)